MSREPARVRAAGTARGGDTPHACARPRALPRPPTHVRAPVLPVRLSISMPIVMREGKAWGLIRRSGLQAHGRGEGGGWGGAGVRGGGGEGPSAARLLAAPPVCSHARA